MDIIDNYAGIKTAIEANQECLSIIKQLNKKKKHGNIIYNLAFCFYYAYEDENILDFAGELQKMEKIYSVAIVDHENKIKGIINRRDFFDMLGIPYGRDIYKNRNLPSVMKPAKSFSEEKNIFSIAEILKEDIKDIDNKYYTLVDENDNFSGIFSTKSILIYLSEITQNDLELAEKLQKRIVSHEIIENGDGIEILCYSKMAKGVGGDFYYIKKNLENKFIAALCDVSGKGISASLLASLLGGIFNIYDFKNGIREFIRILNNYILKTFEMEKFITGIFFEIDIAAKEMIVCDMGHSYFLLCRKGKIYNCISGNNNIPIGIEENIVPVLNKLTIEKDDMIVVYTDGVIEQTNDKNEEYSLNRLKRLLKKNINETPENIKKKLNDEIHGFRNNHYQQDDITFMIIKF